MKGLNIDKIFTLLVTLVAAGVLSGCIMTIPEPEQQLPIRDTRPQLQFTIHQSAEAGDYHVYLNDLRLGTVADFLLHTDSLRTLSGRQQLKIVRQNEVILARELFLQDGARQFIHVPTEHEPVGSVTQAHPKP